MSVEKLKQLVVNALEDLKAQEIKVLHVGKKTTIADYMIICSGRSTRQVKAIADNVFVKAKQAGYEPLGVEGENGCEWVLVDLGDVIVHVMLPETREYYAIEKLWE